MDVHKLIWRPWPPPRPPGHWLQWGDTDSGSAHWPPKTCFEIGERHGTSELDSVGPLKKTLGTRNECPSSMTLGQARPGSVAGHGYRNEVGDFVG